jgi:L-fuculose-phosphate aldolase
MSDAFESVARAREQLVEAGRTMRSARLVIAREGNLSMRVARERVLVTPAGADKGRLEPVDLVEVDLDGGVIGSGRPSNEVAMHLEIYRRRPDTRAVAHGHPVHATAFAVAGRALDRCLLPEVVVTLGCVPLVPYATPSTGHLPRAVAPVCESHDAFLLQNHGAVALGDDPRSAVDRLETVERLAEITWRAEALGGARALSRSQVAELMETFGDAGRSSRPLPECQPDED